MNRTIRGRELLWRKPEIPVLEDLGDGAAADIEVANPLRDLIADVGIPTFANVTPREDAIMLLQTAAEIEHALMAQYLYALYSLKSASESEELQEGLQTIVVQEMGHLMTVQNLLLSLGEPPYFSRQDLSPQADKDPIPFRLEPFTKHSLAKYVAAESPLLMPGDPDQAELDTIFEEARIASSFDVHRVGLIYAAIYWLFQRTDNIEPPWNSLPSAGFQPGWHISDGDLHFGPSLVNRQADSSEWAASVSDLFIDPTESREKALEALWRIAAQGEGFEVIDGSHFSRFRDAYRKFDDLPQPPHLEIPINPTTGPDPLADPNLEHNRIGNSRTRLWCDLFNRRYRWLLICLQHTFSHDKADTAANAIRVTLKGWSMREMRQGLRTIAREMKRQPRFEADNPSSTTFFAAAPFGLSAAEVDLPDTELGRWQLHKDINDGSLALLEQMLSLGDLTPSELSCLKGIKGVSTDRVAFIATQIATHGG